MSIKQIRTQLKIYKINFYIFFIYLIFLIIGCTSEGEMNMHNESESIIAETRAFADAWNHGDAKKAASFFTEDAVRIGAFGDVQRGRDELEAAYDRLLHQTMPGAQVKQETGTVRMLTQELAIWEGSIEIIPPDGTPSLKGHVVQVMKKTDGRWLILEAHPKLFPPPPDKQ